jgi:hypothetical protein
MAWCSRYNCWCDEAEDIMDGLEFCDYICADCEYAEEDE